MSMEINSSYHHYKTNYSEHLKTEWEKMNETEKVQKAEKETEKMPVIKKAQEEAKEMFAIKDEYINSEKSDKKLSGLYRLGKDEKGNPKVLFDNPKKSGYTDENRTPQVKSGSPENKPEKCTANTDKVDREIKKLKEEKEKLEQQIQRVFENEKEVRELKRKLSQVENELSQKDNDTYRMQHASVLQG